MAKKLQAKKITEALQKAQRVGEVEERFTVAGCEVVLRNLRPEEFEAVVAETEDLEEGLSYINVFKKGHVCRSLIELNGESLREYDFVEVDVEELDPVTKQPVQKTITLERHKFVYDYVLATWSREAVDIAYRKFLDVTAKSEAEASNGVEFILPDETPEDKFNRLLLEVKELEAQLPFELSKRILEEVGYVATTSKEEGEKVVEVLSKVAVEPPPEDDQEPARAPQRAAPVRPAPVEAPEAPKTDLKSMLQARTPLNQRSVAVPVPMEAPPVVDPQPVPQPRMIQGQAIPPSPAVLNKSRDIASLEGFDPNEIPLGIQGGSQLIGTTVEGIPVLGEQVPKTNEQGVLSVLNKPAQGALNPRYRPPNRF